MASFLQHRMDCRRFLGSEFADVHTWLDACFSELGPYHRRARHHKEGLDEIREIFGEEAVAAGVIHILRDCRHIPRKADYDAGFVDPLGLKKSWSTAAYIKYSDEEFEEVVAQHFKPTGLILWAFLAWDDAHQFLNALTRFNAEEIDRLELKWNEARTRLESEPAAPSSPHGFVPLSDLPNVESDTRAYLEEVFVLATASEPPQNRAAYSVGYVPIERLVNPLVFIDYELLEEIKPELASTSPLDVAKFALPKSVRSNVKAVADPSQQSVTFVSNQKTLRVSNVRVRNTQEGTEVSYIISASSSGILVNEQQDRLLIKNGIHRAYLLAQLGIKEVPCLHAVEQSPLPIVSSSYPVFNPIVLIQPRHPMLSDFMKPELCLQAPMQKMNRVIRVGAENTLIPVE